MFLHRSLLIFVQIVYFCTMNENEIYYHVRIAVRDSKDPQAYLRLGTLYAKGIGTRENHVLANYFYEKALAMGCLKAESYIEQEYESGARDIVEDAKRILSVPDAIAPKKMTS